jgi:hypothetical protein
MIVELIALNRAVTSPPIESECVMARLYAQSKEY